MLFKDITPYTYSYRELRKFVRKDDFWKYDLNEPEKLEDILKEISEYFVCSNYSINTITKHYIKSMTLFTMDTFYDAVTIRCTDNIIRTATNFTACSRDNEITQLWNMISSELDDCWIIRTDIHSFFENIPFLDIIHKLRDNLIICNSTYLHLLSIYNSVYTDKVQGLPRGLPISSSLSDYSMHDFDKYVVRVPGVVYYSRYVDDIVIITHSAKETLELIKSQLPYNMRINFNKTHMHSLGTDDNIEYLGYSFPLKKPITACISSRKLGKIKQRIVLTLRAFLRDHNYGLLLERLQFITGITELHMADREKIFAVGIRYQYRLCNEELILRQLGDLDTFLQRILRSKRYSISRRIRATLSQQQYSYLLRISFVSGFRKMITHSRSRNRIAEIKNAWRYE